MKIIAKNRIQYLYNKQRLVALPGEEVEVTKEDGQYLIEKGAAEAAKAPAAKAPAAKAPAAKAE